MTDANTTNAAKVDAFEYLDRNAGAVALLNDNIFYFGELGMHEVRTAGLMIDLLEKAGFTVERGIAGFPTGFCATYGSGAPVIAIHTEYDANPDNSQRAGVAEHSPIVDGAPGHCEGHNCNGAVLISGALAIKAAMARHKLPGTLKVFGAPAEEQVISRPYFVRDGWFDDVDAAITPHIGSEFGVGYGLIQSALISAEFTFHGETAHAGVAPWKGRDALDAVVLMDMGLAQHREHMMPTMRCQRVITNGGNQPNVVPRTAATWWFFRDSTAAGAMSLFETAKTIAQGAALMTRTTFDVNVLSAVWPVRGNQTVAETVQRNYELVGAPSWSADEDALARNVQRAAKVPDQGLSTSISRMSGPAVQKPAANDAGDISWKVPHAKMYFPSNIPNINFHHWAAGVSLATSIAHKGAVAGAKVLAGSVIDLLASPDLLAEAKATFAKELDGLDYATMLPPDQKPPLDLNRKMMEQFRPLMEPHYLKELPVFAD